MKKFNRKCSYRILFQIGKNFTSLDPNRLPNVITYKLRPIRQIFLEVENFTRFDIQRYSKSFYIMLIPLEEDRVSPMVVFHADGHREQRSGRTNSPGHANSSFHCFQEI